VSSSRTVAILSLKSQLSKKQTVAPRAGNKPAAQRTAAFEHLISRDRIVSSSRTSHYRVSNRSSQKQQTIALKTDNKPAAQIDSCFSVRRHSRSLPCPSERHASDHSSSDGHPSKREPPRRPHPPAFPSRDPSRQCPCHNEV